MLRTIRMEQTVVQAWLSKDEAAAILKISARRVLEFVQAGALKSQVIRDPKTNQMTKQIDAADVAKLREERENPRPQPSQALVPQVNAVVRKTAGRPPSQEPQTSALPLSELKIKLFLAEDEAVRYTGLSATYLRDRLDGGQKIGPRGSLVYRRKDLEEL
jgi:hypothetical protein